MEVGLFAFDADGETEFCVIGWNRSNLIDRIKITLRTSEKIYRWLKYLLSENRPKTKNADFKRHTNHTLENFRSSQQITLFIQSFAPTINLKFIPTAKTLTYPHGLRHSAIRHPLPILQR